MCLPNEVGACAIFAGEGRAKLPTHQDSPHLVAKSCCFLADARIEVRTCAHWQTDGSSCAAPRHQQTAYATLLGLSLLELCEKMDTAGAVLPAWDRLLQPLR